MRRPRVRSGSRGVTLSVPVVAGVLAAVAPCRSSRRRACSAGRAPERDRAITRGSMPSPGGRPSPLLRRVHELRLPTPLRLGLAAGVAQPVRAAMMLGALVVGVAALVFAPGSTSRSTSWPSNSSGTSRVRSGSSSGTVPYPPAQVTSAIADDPDTGHFTATAERQVAVPGLGPVPFVAYQGDATWIGTSPSRGAGSADPVRRSPRPTSSPRPGSTSATGCPSA